MVQTFSWWMGHTSPEHYWCHVIFVKTSRQTCIMHTVYFKHKYINQPTVTLAHVIVKALQDLEGPHEDNQIATVEHTWMLLKNARLIWSTITLTYRFPATSQSIAKGDIHQECTPNCNIWPWSKDANSLHGGTMDDCCWCLGSTNWAEYRPKHHPPIHHWNTWSEFLMPYKKLLALMHTNCANLAWL